ncbi:glycosyltransferase family 2 protein (plasmid) [Tundrisphaera lichenicola]|uniref:glycosyltransferase family 2 protein n=1 Tax=Tundrisphaera lichenicola TaxID=2029860 RepID=UPI003EBC63DA
MSPNPRVTVIIPNYRHARYLPRRLESVVGQSFRDIEVLFLDDASPDDSRAVFESHPASSDPRVRPIYNEQNSGSPFKQWNRGLREARGEYIWIAESDDAADETMLAELVARLDANPNVGLAYCQSWIVGPDDEIKSSYTVLTDSLDREHWKSDFISGGLDECRRYLAFQNTIPNASAVLLRREVVDRVGPAPEEFRLSGDWVMWARMMMAADVAFVARPLNYHRVHPETVRHSSEREGQHLNEAFRAQTEIARAVGLPRVHRVRLAKAMAWTWLMARRNRDKGPRFTLERDFRMMRTIAAMHWQSMPVVAGGLGLEVLERLGLRERLRKLKRAIVPPPRLTGKGSAPSSPETYPTSLLGNPSLANPHDE